MELVMKHTLKALAAILVLACAQSAQAAPLLYRAILSGPNEFPPQASPGFGQADVFVDPVANTLQVNVVFGGLLGTTTASHIHCCTATPFAAATAGVATAVPTFPGFPLGVTSGTYTSIVFDMLDPLSYNPAFITSHGGTAATAEAALFAGIFANEAYLNVHSSFAGSGEIRGFLVFVPEPVTLSVFGAGLAGVALLRRRRKAKAKA
jgi:hypothetical protein